MEIYQRLEDIRDRPAVALAIGSFDGLHRGHRAIIATVREEAKERGVKSMIMTFSPTPREVLSGEHEVALMRTEEKIAHLRSLSIDILCIIAFDQEFAKTGRDTFIQGLLTYLDLKVLVAGPDHHIGNRHEGGIAYLKETGAMKGFDLVIVPKAEYACREISSQLIRKKLKEGRIEDVNAMLGYSYRLTGKVVRGEQRGRMLGFPTMNILPDQRSCVIPAMGVYCVKLLLDGQCLPAVCNIGMRPTFSADKLSLEVHVPDMKLSEEYGKTLAVQFERFIRNEKKFENAEALIAEIKEDIKKCKTY